MRPSPIVRVCAAGRGRWGLHEPAVKPLNSSVLLKVRVTRVTRPLYEPSGRPSDTAEARGGSYKDAARYVCVVTVVQ